MNKDVEKLQEVEEVKVEEEVKPKPKKPKVVKVEEEVSEPVVKAKPKPLKKGRVFGISQLRVRKAASTKSEVIKLLFKDDVVDVDVEGSTENFYRIFLNPKDRKKEAFVVKDFIELMER